jgi:phosphatidylglycerophosphatase C
VSPNPSPQLASPRPGQPVVAAFDFDGTLAHGGSVWQFLVAMTGRVKATAAGLREAPRILVAAIKGGSANDKAKEALFVRVLGGRDARDIQKLARAFGLAHFDKRVRPDVYERMRAHIGRGDRIVIVSASPELYLAPVAEKVGASGLVGTRLEASNGKLTGHYDGLNCRGPEKWRRLDQWITASEGDSETRPFVWAYGNSAGDRDMLRNADVGVDVGRLGRFGKLKDFAQFGDLPPLDQPGTDAAPTTVPL